LILITQFPPKQKIQYAVGSANGNSINQTFTIVFRQHGIIGQLGGTQHGLVNNVIADCKNQKGCKNIEVVFVFQVLLKMFNS
jgi:hypothetical protein